MGMLMRRRIHEIQEKQKEIKEPDTFNDSDEVKEPEEVVVKYSKEELFSMTVKQIKEIAASLGFTINKVIKEDVIAEFLAQQK